jgi:RNA polymerase sigma-70 factor (ECF subfamily)
MPQHELSLIDAALTGDGRAFRQLVEPHLRMLHRVATRGCGDPNLAEDVVQETLVLCFHRLGDLRDGSTLRAFMAGVAAKKSRTMARGERRRKRREDASMTPALPSNPNQDLQAARSARKIREALLAMPEKRREAALLRLDGGLSYREIAEAIGSTEGSTRVLVHKALAELRERLAEWINPESVNPQSVSPQSVSPQSVSPQSVSPQSVSPEPLDQEKMT